MKNRMTQTRERLEHIFQTHPEPLSLAEALEYVQVFLPKTAYSTVFRLVQKLEDEQKIRRIDWRERGSRYEWAALPHHHHIVCQKCGSILDLDDEQFGFSETLLEKVTGFKVTYHSVELEGVCPACQLKTVNH